MGSGGCAVVYSDAVGAAATKRKSTRDLKPSCLPIIFLLIRRSICTEGSNKLAYSRGV